MTITASTADQLETLALAVFNPNVQPNPAQAGSGTHYDPAFFTGIKGQDDATDAQFYALVAPLTLAIDGRTMAAGFKYTLNVTNALQGRPKHWFIQGLYELDSVAIPPCSVNLMFYPAPGGSTGDVGHFGFTLGTCMVAGICNTWAYIVRQWLAGNYPQAVTQPTP